MESKVNELLEQKIISLIKSGSEVVDADGKKSPSCLPYVNALATLQKVQVEAEKNENARVLEQHKLESEERQRVNDRILEEQKLEIEEDKRESERLLEERRLALEEAKNRLEKRRQNIDCVKIGVGVAGVAVGTYASAKSIAFAAAKEEGGAIRTNALKGAMKWFESMAQNWAKLLNSFR